MFCTKLRAIFLTFHLPHIDDKRVALWMQMTVTMNGQTLPSRIHMQGITKKKKTALIQAYGMFVSNAQK